MKDAQWRASQAAMLDQEVAGIDVINGGEMHRRQNNRHAPPNAMLNFFWQKIPGFEKDPNAEYGIVTRPRPITPKDPNVFHPAAVCTGRIEEADIGLVEEFEIDEPLFAVGGIERSEVEAAIEAVNQCFEGVKAFKWVHVCQGNYAVGAHYDGQIGHRYFDIEEYPTELICRLECDAIMNEGDMTPRYEGQLRNQQLAVGVADVQDMNVESPETLTERIGEWGGSWLPEEQTLITSSCGMNHLPRHIALGKLMAMSGAREILRAA